jgi:hypothetical protein
MEHKNMIDIFSVNPSEWTIEGNFVSDELDDPNVYALYKSTLQTIGGSLPVVGHSSIKVETAGQQVNEGIMEYPFTVDVNIGDSIWHSVYLKGSGTVELVAMEKDNTGAYVGTDSFATLILSNEYQLLEINSIIQEGSLICFDVLTTSIQDITFNLNGVYVNRGDTPRTGLNLVADNVASTGGNGSTDGFLGVNSTISVISGVNILEMDYSQIYSTKENK